MPTWTPHEHEQGLNALEFLRCRLPAAPLAYLRQLLRRRKVMCGAASVREQDLVRPGHCLHLPESARIGELLEAGAALGVRVLWETPQLLIVDKLAGLAVHRGQGHEDDNLLLRLARLYEYRGENTHPAPVHRLDRGTSGVLLLGKERSATGALGKMFMAGAAQKIYLALVHGAGRGSGLLDSPLAAKGKIKDAATGYRFLSSDGSLSLVELRLETGRTHQIRRHLAAFGHPLVGDRRYGAPGSRGADHFFLHCRELAFVTPWDDVPRRISAPLPEHFHAALSRLRLPPGE
ncbi:RluA family pseudouridine synthase [Geoalkalibacter halelectricus]